MAKFQTKDWISTVLFIIAIILMSFHIFSTADSTKNVMIEKAGWIMMIIASLYTIFAYSKKDKLEKKS